MKKCKWTLEEIQWLKENFATKTDHFCRNHLHVSYKRLWEKAEELGLKKEKPSDFEKDRQVQVKTKKKCLHEDENAQNYCLTCTYYLHGGLCTKTQRWVGALWKKKCCNGEA